MILSSDYRDGILSRLLTLCRTALANITVVAADRENLRIVIQLSVSIG